MKEILEKVRQFAQERDWEKYHTPANLAKSIVLESAELLEIFQWNEEEYDVEHLKEELADVLLYCFQMADRLHLDIKEIMFSKMEKNALKYPIVKSMVNVKSL